MDANTIGMNRFAPIGMFSAALSCMISGGLDPTTRNLKAVVAMVDGILGFEKPVFGVDTGSRNVSIYVFEQYRIAATSAMTLKKSERSKFLQESNVQLLKKIMSEHSQQMNAEIAKMDKSERAVMQQAIDKVIGKKEKAKLRLI